MRSFFRFQFSKLFSSSVIFSSLLLSTPLLACFLVNQPQNSSYSLAQYLSSLFRDLLAEHLRHPVAKNSMFLLHALSNTYSDWMFSTVFQIISAELLLTLYPKSDVAEAFASTSLLITNNANICNRTTHTEMLSYWLFLNICTMCTTHLLIICFMHKYDAKEMNEVIANNGTNSSNLIQLFTCKKYLNIPLTTNKDGHILYDCHFSNFINQ